MCLSDGRGWSFILYSRCVFSLCGENVSPVFQKWLNLTIKLSFYLPVVRLVVQGFGDWCTVFSMACNHSSHHRRVHHSCTPFLKKYCRRQQSVALFIVAPFWSFQMDKIVYLSSQLWWRSESCYFSETEIKNSNVTNDGVLLNMLLLYSSRWNHVVKLILEEGIAEIKITVL